MTCHIICLILATGDLNTTFNSQAEVLIGIFTSHDKSNKYEKSRITCIFFENIFIFFRYYNHEGELLREKPTNVSQRTSLRHS